MRTTLDIDDDILMAAKELAKAAHKTAGQIISEFSPKITHDSAQLRGRRAKGDLRHSAVAAPRRHRDL